MHERVTAHSLSEQKKTKMLMGVVDPKLHISDDIWFKTCYLTLVASNLMIDLH